MTVDDNGQPTPPARDDLPSALPEARLDERRRVSLVWLIPLVALLAAGWLGYRAYTEQGPLVTITFESAEGLEAGKTRVRYKDVDIGLVEAIDLSDGLDTVLVRARLSRQVAGYMNERARFWVVRPRLTRGQVSGLGTLVGGAYIGADLAAGGEARRRFQGLESPPIVTAVEPGKAYTLIADELGSLAEGSPILYRGIEVGRVVGYTLREDQMVAISVFVDAPYDVWVGHNTRFWNASGVGVSLDARGIRLNTDSLASVLLGGVAFGTPDGSDHGSPVPADTEFRLHADRDAAIAPTFAHRETWQLAFSGSIRGLVAGAPVEFRGIRIGEVTDIRLHVNVDERSAEIPVTIAIEPGRLGVDAVADATGGERRRLWNELVNKGLRAQLKTGNLLSGSLYVDLDFYPDAPAGSIVWSGEVPRLPTVMSPLDQLSGLVSKLSRLPLDTMGEDLAGSLAELRATMQATNTLLQRLDRETASELNSTLVQTRRTLSVVEKTLAQNSPLQTEAHRVLNELGSAARSLRIMADYLERHPEALLRGKGAESP